MKFPPTTTYLLLEVHQPASRARDIATGPGAMVAVWPGEASGAQLDQTISIGVREGIMKTHHGLRLQMHVGLTTDLPRGKEWDKPDWTNGDVRMWTCDPA